MPVAAILALVAFAANSLLCRLALRSDDADPITFTLVRLVAGAAMLWGLGLVRRWPAGGGSWWGGLWLAVYAVGFSWAYVRIDAGVGALLLFGCVQLTMLVAAVRAREAMPPVFWVGLGLAALGVVWLVRPGASAVALAGAVPMALAGLAWGQYSLVGRGSTRAEADTRGNFWRAAVLAVPMLVLLTLGTAFTASSGTGQMMSVGFPVSTRGLVLAATSGAVTSGLGYVLWYAAVRHMTASRAAALQLAVPVLTAVLAVPLLGERPTLRLAVATALVLGGIGLTIQRRAPNAGPR